MKHVEVTDHGYGEILDPTTGEVASQHRQEKELIQAGINLALETGQDVTGRRPPFTISITDRAAPPGPTPAPTPPPAGDPLEGGVAPTKTSYTEFPETPPTTTGSVFVDFDNGDNVSDGKDPSRPVRSMQRARSLAGDGGTVLVLPSTLVFSESGGFVATEKWTKGLRVLPYGATRWAIDGSKLPRGTGSGTPENGRALQLNGERETWEGFDLIGVQSYDGAVYIQGAYNRLARVVGKSLGGPGDCTALVMIYGGRHNTVLDCENENTQLVLASDTNSGDTFQAAGGAEDNAFVRVAGMFGLDDGLDVWTSWRTRVVGSVLIDAGRDRKGAPGAGSGDGFGVKLGSPKGGGGASAEGTLVYRARGSNFAHNQSPNGGILCAHCTSIQAGLHGFDMGGGSGVTNTVRDSIDHLSARAPYLGAAAVSERNGFGQDTAPFINPGTYVYAVRPSSPYATMAADGGPIGAYREAILLAKKHLRRLNA